MLRFVLCDKNPIENIQHMNVLSEFWLNWETIQTVTLSRLIDSLTDSKEWFISESISLVQILSIRSKIHETQDKIPCTSELIQMFQTKLRKDLYRYGWIGWPIPWKEPTKEWFICA